MASFLDRLLGRPEPVKAVVGAGAYWMEHGTPLRSISRDPLRLLAEAQKVYHSNEWVHAAESLIDGKFATVGFHLEREGETVEETAAPELHRLLRNPDGQSRGHLWRITCRHLGLTGNAFWYLDQQDALGIPLRVIYLNPARMTPASDTQGVLRGWIVDADRPDGRDPTPLDAAEVIHFVLDPPDFGHYGIGKVESAWRKVGLSNASASFAEGTLLSGGRKAHLIWPDGVTVEGDAWDQWLNGLRSVQEEGSFTRRLTANRFPVGSMETGQTLTEMALPDLSRMARDDILAIWGVPPSQLGVYTTTRGLNSGETQKYEEAALWQNAIEPRLATFAEQVQSRLIDPFGYTLVLEVPAFDDDAPLYEIASQAVNVPLKVDERRALVGLDPLDEKVYGQLGQAILIATSIVELTEKQEVPEALVPFAGRNNTDNDDEEMPNPGEVAGKATLHFTNLRQRMEKAYTPKLQRTVGEALAEQGRAIAAAVRKSAAHLATKPNDTDTWWNEKRENERLSAALDPTVASLLREVSTKTSAAFFASTKANDFLERVAAYVRQRVGGRIKDINKTTRDAIRTLVGNGVRSGLSPAELAQTISEATSFNAARAELIARTETMLAYNDAAIGTYRAFDVEQVQAIDGDHDAECAARNGNTYSIDEASGISDHPNGTLDWVPVVKARSAKAELEAMGSRFSDELHANVTRLEGLLKERPVHVEVQAPPASNVEVRLPDGFHLEPIPAPIIPPIEIPPTVVHMDTSRFEKVVEDLRATLTKPRTRTVERDARGQIIRIVEE